jgi:hypothetical protein
MNFYFESKTDFATGKMAKHILPGDVSRNTNPWTSNVAKIIKMLIKNYTIYAECIKICTLTEIWLRFKAGVHKFRKPDRPGDWILNDGTSNPWVPSTETSVNFLALRILRWLLISGKSLRPTLKAMYTHLTPVHPQNVGKSRHVV